MKKYVTFRLGLILLGFWGQVHAQDLAILGRVEKRVDMPALKGNAWQIAGNPDLGQYSTDKQEPVDFAVWQAADGSWQLWSCIRRTNYGGKNRLFYRWEGTSLELSDWKPMGIVMEADESVGETKGGLQAPHVVLHDGKYHMLYGDWNHICHAVSEDGKTFTRALQANGKTGIYSDGEQCRDPMAILIDGLWHVYSTSHPNRQCVIRCRTTPDFQNWAPNSATVAFGGRGGAGPYSAECPQVVKHKGLYYLFRTETYRSNPKTHVYVSSDPLHFGINRDEWYFLTTLDLAAPEYVKHDGQEYIVTLNTNLDGIHAQRLVWVSANEETKVEQRLE